MRSIAMSTVSILEAKMQLSRLVARVESGAEAEIIIARNGRPAARLVPLTTRPAQRRIGIAAGQFKVPESIDLSKAQLEHLFAGDPNL
jgi:prevent-host-death family protein